MCLGARSLSSRNDGCRSGSWSRTGTVITAVTQSTFGMLPGSRSTSEIPPAVRTASSPVLPITAISLSPRCWGPARQPPPVLREPGRLRSSLEERHFAFSGVDGVQNIAFDENAAASRLLSTGHCVLSFSTGSQLALNRRAFPKGRRTCSRCRAIRPRMTWSSLSRRLVSLSACHRSRRGSASGSSRRILRSPVTPSPGSAAITVPDPWRHTRVSVQFSTSRALTRKGTRRHGLFLLLQSPAPAAPPSPSSEAALRASFRRRCNRNSSTGVSTSCSTWGAAVSTSRWPGRDSRASGEGRSSSLHAD